MILIRVCVLLALFSILVFNLTGDLEGNKVGLVFFAAVILGAVWHRRARERQRSEMDDMKRRGMCFVCKGTGRVAPYAPYASTTCYGCKGSGRMHYPEMNS